MDYNNPIQAGKDAFASGLKRYECPADPRTHANIIEWWKQGWDEAAKNCNGFEIENGTGDFSGCGK